MDTRNKILSAAAARELLGQARRCGAPMTVVTGTFDVLQASHVRDLRSIVGDAKAGPLLVVLSPPRQPILSERARAEMVAALGMVDYVVTAGEGVLDSLPPDAVVHLDAADERRTQQLIEHVHRRQTG